MRESEIVLRGWLIDRGTFIITISAFLLGVKENLFCIDAYKTKNTHGMFVFRPRFIHQ